MKINDKAEEVIENLFDSLFNIYQNNLKTFMRSSDFAFDCVHLLHYKCHKINPNCGGSCTDSPDMIKSKKPETNPIHKRDNKSFQYAVGVALNDE